MSSLLRCQQRPCEQPGDLAPPGNNELVLPSFAVRIVSVEANCIRFKPDLDSYNAPNVHVYKNITHQTKNQEDLKLNDKTSKYTQSIDADTKGTEVLELSDIYFKIVIKFNKQL